MSDQGEKTCPLCAEEMDLTDQQLKPCKCGYEICVWCWHQIMDMAEKNETEGRCPACRTPYNKEKIVGTAANCERLVSEINVEKRAKLQKGKSKTEGRKNLASVRVIQRHLVYVIGMPLNLADEDLLQRREYFGQYGKVLKVSISRTSAGAIQQFPNSTCSVYVTYSNEDEAVRCIQSLQGFVLDGRPLKACFGTTKYCHAWLRNVPCSNPDCLYLHEVGSEEISFTKDEIITAYTRDKLQQNSSLNAAQRRSGNVLPPPADECCGTGSISSGKPLSKTIVNTNQKPATGARVSPPNSSSGRSAALPAGASWGTRASSNQHSIASSPCSSEPPKRKPDTHYIPVTSSNTVASLSHQSSLQHNTGERLTTENNSNVPLASSKAETLELVEQESKSDGLSDVSFSSWIPVTSPSSGQPHAKILTKQLPSSEVADTSLKSDKPGFKNDSCGNADVNVNRLCSDISAMSMNENQLVENGSTEVIRESVFSQTSDEVRNIIEMPESSDVQSNLISKPAHAVQDDLWDIEDDLVSFESQRVNDPEVSFNRIPKVSNAFHLSSHPGIHSSPFNNADDSISDDLYGKVVGRNSDLMYTSSNYPSRNQEHLLSTNGAEVNDVGHFNLFPSKEKRSMLGSYEGEMSFNGPSNRGESGIISNILSMDFDPWNGPLTSPENLINLLGEVDNQHGSSRAPDPRRIPNSNQSRFMFAREEESVSQASSAFGQPIDYFGKVSKKQPFGYGFSSSNSSQIDKFDSHNDLSLIGRSESDIFASSSRPHMSSNNLSVPRSPISAPPGFSVPSTRPPPPPPGFAYHGRTEHLLDNFPGNRMFGSSSWSMGNRYQTPESGNVVSDGDIDFIDPAILAVGRGMLPSGFNRSQNFAQQFNNNASEEARFQSLFNRSPSPQQNQRHSDDYAIPSRFMEQTLVNNVTSFAQSRSGMNSNGQWNNWSEVQGGKNLGMTERLGINKFYGGYDDSKIRMPGSGNLFNGTYGI